MTAILSFRSCRVACAMWGFPSLTSHPTHILAKRCSPQQWETMGIRTVVCGVGAPCSLLVCASPLAEFWRIRFRFHMDLCSVHAKFVWKPSVLDVQLAALEVERQVPYLPCPTASSSAYSTSSEKRLHLRLPTSHLWGHPRGRGDCTSGFPIHTVEDFGAATKSRIDELEALPGKNPA